MSMLYVWVQIALSIMYIRMRICYSIICISFTFLIMWQMLRALSAYLGLAPECPSEKKEKERSLPKQQRPLLDIPTWPALKEVLSLLPKGELACAHTYICAAMHACMHV